MLGRTCYVSRGETTWRGAIHPPPYTQAHRCSWLATQAVFDQAETVCHSSLPSSLRQRANFALWSSWPWMAVASLGYDLLMIEWMFYCCTSQEPNWAFLPFKMSQNQLRSQEEVAWVIALTLSNKTPDSLFKKWSLHRYTPCCMSTWVYICFSTVTSNSWERHGANISA